MKYLVAPVTEDHANSFSVLFFFTESPPGVEREEENVLAASAGFFSRGFRKRNPVPWTTQNSSKRPARNRALLEEKMIDLLIFFI